MNGAVIVIENASAADTILSVKRRVFATNRELPVRRQRLVYRPGPHGMNSLANDETLGGAGVAQDGSAELDVLLVDLAMAEAADLGPTLLLAAQNGDANSVLELLDEGASTEYKDQIGYTALIWAAENGRTDCVRLLINAGADTEAKHKGGDSALTSASYRGRTECVRLLIDAGADKEDLDNYGYTALILAAENGHTDCARLLIDAGADTKTKHYDGKTALDMARKNGHAEIVRLLSFSPVEPKHRSKHSPFKRV